jgi:hypothetical protein
MNSDRNVNLRDERRATACSRRGTLALLHSPGPNKTRAPRPHAPCPQASTNPVRPGYRPEIVNAPESLVRTTRRRRATSARRDVGSRGNRVAARPRMPPTRLSHDWLNNYLIGIADCTKPCGTCGTETSLDLSDSGKRSANPSWRAGRLRHQMLSHCWQTNSILSATPRYRRTVINAHRCLALMRILTSRISHSHQVPEPRTE